MSSVKTMSRMNDRVAQLQREFRACLQAFDKGQLFTGPSLYFHFKTVEIRAQHSSATAALNDSAFVESLYATLTAWGMHRMGPRGAKLVEFDRLLQSLQSQASRIQELEAVSLATLEPEQEKEICSKLWGIMDSLKVSASRAKIVAASKALHHVLPALVPPIDRQYTLRFFYNNTMINAGGEKTFREIFPYLRQVAVKQREEIGKWLGRGMHTSSTKVIDNAIVGYGIRHLKPTQADGE